LVYRQEAALLVEINFGTVRVTQHDSLTSEEYRGFMIDNVDDLAESRVLWVIEKEKLKVARAYNERVREKTFQVGDMVWKTILPLGLQSNRFGKWSSS
jgi:hypothetical protein